MNWVCFAFPLGNLFSCFMGELIVHKPVVAGSNRIIDGSEIITVLVNYTLLQPIND